MVQLQYLRCDVASSISFLFGVVSFGRLGLVLRRVALLAVLALFIFVRFGLIGLVSV